MKLTEPQRKAVHLLRRGYQVVVNIDGYSVSYAQLRCDQGVAIPIKKTMLAALINKGIIKKHYSFGQYTYYTLTSAMRLL